LRVSGAERTCVNCRYWADNHAAILAQAGALSTSTSVDMINLVATFGIRVWIKYALHGKVRIDQQRKLLHDAYPNTF
jgi:hypothetical protein